MALLYVLLLISLLVFFYVSLRFYFPAFRLSLLAFSRSLLPRSLDSLMEQKLVFVLFSRFTRIRK